MSLDDNDSSSIKKLGLYRADRLSRRWQDRSCCGDCLAHEERAMAKKIPLDQLRRISRARPSPKPQALPEVVAETEEAPERDSGSA